MKQATAPRSDDGTADSTELVGLGTYAYGTHDQVARFTNTTKDIAEHAGTTYKYGKEIWKLLMKKTEATFTEPSAPKDETKRPPQSCALTPSAMAVACMDAASTRFPPVMACH